MHQGSGNLCPGWHGKLGGGGGGWCAAVRGEINQRGIGFVPNRGNQRNRAFGRGANNDFLIEGHQVFQAATAARHNQHIGARHGAAFRQGGKSPDGGGNLFRRALALHRDGP